MSEGRKEGREQLLDLKERRKDLSNWIAKHVNHNIVPIISLPPDPSVAILIFIFTVTE
jgi:hypothetical protein